MSEKRDSAVSKSNFPSKKAQLQTDAYYGMTLSRIGPGLVMSRNNNGSVLSLFDHDEWFLPAFAFSVSDNPYFNFSQFRQAGKFNSENVDFSKRMFTIKMFTTVSNTGKPLRIPTMQYLFNSLSYMNTYSNKQNIKIQALFESVSSFKSMLATIPASYYKSISGLVRTLVRTDSTERGFIIDGKILSFLKENYRNFRNDGDQHSIIPSRILLAKYKQYKECLEDYCKNRTAIEGFIEAIIEDPFLARGRYKRFALKNEFKLLPSKTKTAYTKEPPTFRKVINKYNLNDLAAKYKWRSIMNTCNFLSLVQHCAKCLIHLLTLMRDAEVLNLPVDCLESIEGWNNEALYVCGTSTKLEGERTIAKWITTDEILEPVKILQSIQKIIAKYAGADVDTNLLLLAPSHLPCYGRPSKRGVALNKSKIKLPDVLITEADILELETIDPYRDWRNDKRFEIGKPWQISSHQFRRSIAVFAGQSGLITLPSLKRLLRHITNVMTAYYMKGCSAKNYLFSDINPQLTRELKRAKEEADAAVFIRDVLKSAEQMYGFAGRRAMEMREQSPWLAGTVEDTKQQVKLGLMAYQETPAGGCTSPLPCDKRAHAKMDACSTCKQFVGQEAKMAETIEIMEFDLAELKPGTIEYRAELQNLEDFKAFRARVIARG